MSLDSSKVDSTTVLDKHDLGDILVYLKGLKAQCFKIGTLLHLEQDELDSIKKGNTDLAEAMTQILTNWLKKNYDFERFGKPTWKALAEAVANSIGGNDMDLALKIVAAHPAGASSVSRSNKPPNSGSLEPATKPAHNPDDDKLPPPVIGGKDPNFFEDSFQNQTQIDGWGFAKKLSFKRHQPDPKEASIAKKTMNFSFGSASILGGVKRTSIAGSYDMHSWPHGVAVIINNEKFVEQAKRKGTGIDEKNLVTALKYLGYVVEVYRDCTAEKIKDIIEENRQRDHSTYDSFICCILSHGKSGYIYGTDNKMVSLNLITSKLNGDNCVGLAGKPKMFFTQACRGSLRDYGVRVQADGDEETQEDEYVLTSTGTRVTVDGDTKIPGTCDFLFGHASAAGHVAWRNCDEGSWYIHELCLCIASYARFASIADIGTIINRRVSREYASDEEECKTSPEMTSRLRKDVFFF